MNSSFGLPVSFLPMLLLLLISPKICYGKKHAMVPSFEKNNLILVTSDQMFPIMLVIFGEMFLSTVSLNFQMTCDK